MSDKCPYQHETRSVVLAPEADPTPGWPRPRYKDPESGRYLFAQYIAKDMQAQIQVCDLDKTYTAGAMNLCSCCGTQMLKGLVIDAQWINDNTERLESQFEGEDFADIGRAEYTRDFVNSQALDQRSDTSYGSPFCFRCCLLALKHCPFFQGIQDRAGDEARWFVITRADQFEEFDGSFEEFDGSAAIRPVDPDALERISTREVREEVRQGNLFLGTRSASDLPRIERLADFPHLYSRTESRREGREAFCESWYRSSVVKFTPEQVEAMPRGVEAMYQHVAPTRREFLL